MAISVPSKSAQFTDYSATPRVQVKPSDWGSKLRVSYAKLTFTAAGFTSAGAGDIGLIRMPAGRIRVLSDLSRISCPIGTATSDLDVGYGAHTTSAGVAVVLDGDAFAASLDVGGAAIDAAFSLPLVGSLVFDTKDGWDLVCSFDTADSPAAGDLEVWIAYMQGN